MNFINSFFTKSSLAPIFLFTIIALILILIITFYVEGAKKKTGLNIIYLMVAGLFIGIVGLRAHALNNPFYVYMVVLIWNLIFGVLHIFLSGKILEWPKTEPFGWKLLFAAAIVITGFAGLLTFMKMVHYDFNNVGYNLSAVLTFFIPLLFVYAFECYTQIPAKLYFTQKSWIYNKNTELQFRADEISHFFIIKFKLTVQVGGETIISLPMRAPGNIKLGDYFNSTLECYKVTRGTYSIEVRDHSNNYLGWYFSFAEGKNAGKLLDPNKTLLECGLTSPVYFGTAGTEEIESITNQADGEGKSYLINCLREAEYKSQLLNS